MDFGTLKQGLQHQSYEAKLSNKTLTILVNSESEEFSLTAIAAVKLSAAGLDLESWPSRIIDTSGSIFVTIVISLII